MSTLKRLERAAQKVAGRAAAAAAKKKPARKSAVGNRRAGPRGPIDGAQLSTLGLAERRALAASFRAIAELAPQYHVADVEAALARR